jgi:putative spermidine/putrescine transport system substrate-binding protein
MRYASEPGVQGQVARFYGATPVNAGACAALGPSACHALHADAAAPLLKRIAFRHTPVENCGGGRICVPFARWEQTWNELRSS